MTNGMDDVCPRVVATFVRSTRVHTPGATLMVAMALPLQSPDAWTVVTMPSDWSDAV